MRNTGTVTWDDPEREQPYFHQISAGYERELFSGVSVVGRLRPDAGPGHVPQPEPEHPDRHQHDSRWPARLQRSVRHPQREPGCRARRRTTNIVRLRTTKYGYSNYDALNLSVEQRYANNWSLRGAYSLSYSRGVTAGQENTPDLQVGTDLKLDEWYAPSATDRRHNFVMSGRMEVPKTARPRR